jgi:signal transduction histidine kinase
VLIRETSELTRLRRIRTEFVENLSHELRTPVTAIGLLSELLASDTATPGSTSEKIRGRILQIESEAIHLGQMINELLDLARIESGEGMAMNDAIDLDAVVRSSVDRLQPFANQARVKIASRSIGTVPLGREGNATRLAQAIVNLLHNAIKFSPPESTVEVQASQSPDEVRITVTDHGVGISRADLDRIFERFYVADRARSKGGGTGLGLSIARHIVEAHGGTIQASSNLGEGSTFTVVLPRG